MSALVNIKILSMWYNLKDDSNYSNVFVVHRNIGYQSLTFPIIIIIIRRGIIKTITALTALSLLFTIYIGYQSSTFPYNERTSLLFQFTIHCQDVSRVHTSLGISLQFECYSKERD